MRESIGYDDSTAHFKFVNSWGADWGDNGFGYLPYESFETTWDEGWFMDLKDRGFRKSRTGYVKRSWGFQRRDTGFMFHCVELCDPNDVRIAWALALCMIAQWAYLTEQP
jgi:hypothetical protein